MSEPEIAALTNQTQRINPLWVWGIGTIILSGIVLFSIPKIPTNDLTDNPQILSKGTSSLVNGAFQAFMLEHKSITDIKAGDLTQYMNYQSIDTTSIFKKPSPTGNIGIYQGEPLENCSDRLICLHLSDGSILQVDREQSFGGTSSTHAIFFNFDPKPKSTEIGRITFYQFYNGHLATGQSKGISTTKNALMTPQLRDPAYYASQQGPTNLKPTK